MPSRSWSPEEGRSSARRRIDSATTYAPFSRKQAPSASDTRSFPSGARSAFWSSAMASSSRPISLKAIQIVVRLKVRLVDVLLDPLAEAGQHVVEVALLVSGWLLVRDLHPGVALGHLLVQDHRAQVHEVPRGLRLVAHLHLGVLRRHLLFGLR